MQMKFKDCNIHYHIKLHSSNQVLYEIDVTENLSVNFTGVSDIIESLWALIKDNLEKSCTVQYMYLNILSD